MMREFFKSQDRTGWLVVAMAFVGHMFLVGAPVSAMPMIYGPILSEFDWSRSAVAATASFKMLGGVIASLSSGFLIGRFGARTVAINACFGMAFALTLFLGVQSLPMLYFAGAMLGAASLMGIVVFSVIISRWFNNHLGVAIATASIGTSIGGVITPFVMNALLATFDWRTALLALAPPMIVILAPFIYFAYRSPPERTALVNEAKTPGPNVAAEPAPLGERPAQILRTITIWQVGLALLLGSLSDQAMIQHLVLYLQLDANFSPAIAAGALALTFSGGIVGKLMFGVIFDRISVFGISLCYLLLGLAALAISPLFLGVIPVLAANALRGVAHGGVIVDIAVAARHCFGPKPLSFVIGFWTGAALLGSAIGPYAVGLLYDQYQNYNVAFVLIVGAAFAAAFLMLSAKPAYRQLTRRSGGAAEAAAAA